MFTFGLSLLFLLCLANKTQWLKTMLASNFWRLLSDLFYCAYLVHFLIIRWYFSNTRTGFYINSRELIITSLAIFIFSYVIAMPFAFLVELPSRNMVGLILFTMHKVRHGDSEEEDDESASDERQRRSNAHNGGSIINQNFFLGSSKNLAIRDTGDNHVGRRGGDRGGDRAAGYYINEATNEVSSSFISDFKKA